jgi:hypothetical protein
LLSGLLVVSLTSLAAARDSERTGSYPGSSLRQTERLRDDNGNTRGFIDRGPGGDSILRDANRNRVGTTDREQGRTVIRDHEGFTRGTIGR